MKIVLYPIYLSLFIGTSVPLISCSKSSEPAPSTYTELLTTPTWRITGSVSDITMNGSSRTSDDMPSTLSCEKDNFFKFTVTPTQSFIHDEGPTKCSLYDNQTRKGIWDFNNNETVLRYNPGTVYEEDGQILTLTDKTMVLRYNIHFSNGNDPTASLKRTITYTAF